MLQDLVLAAHLKGYQPFARVRIEHAIREHHVMMPVGFTVAKRSDAGQNLPLARCAGRRACGRRRIEDRVAVAQLNDVLFFFHRIRVGEVNQNFAGRIVLDHKGVGAGPGIEQDMWA